MNLEAINRLSRENIANITWVLGYIDVKGKEKVDKLAHGNVLTVDLSAWDIISTNLTEVGTPFLDLIVGSLDAAINTQPDV